MRNRICDFAWSILFLLLIPFFVVLLPVALAWLAVYHLALSASIWWAWCRQGKNVLLVTSDSTIWHDYIAEHILPQLGERAVVLNWSERQSWKRSLAVRAFWHWGGRRDFNPLAIVFQPFRRARVFRFYPPFQDFKRGDPAGVETLTRELLDAVDAIT